MNETKETRNIKESTEKSKTKLTKKHAEILTLMNELYEHWGLHVLLITDPSTQCESVDLGFRKRLYISPQYNQIADLLRSHLEENTFYLYEDELLMNYSLFRLPPELSESLSLSFDCSDCSDRHLTFSSDTDTSDIDTSASSSNSSSNSGSEPFSPVLCVGPILFQSLSTAEISERINTLKINPLYQQDLIEFYNYIPIVSSRELWIHTLMFFLRKLSENPITFRELSFSEKAWGFVTRDEDNYSLPSQPDVALTAIEDRYKAEHDLMEAVASGNTQEAMLRCQRFLSYRLSPRVSSPLRDRKNILFTFNTLLRKSAEAGGVHPLHIDNLSRTLAIQIESAMTVDQLNQIRSGMVRKYCILVQNYSRRAYSQLVQTCMNNIDFYYNTELSLSWLARQCAVSESHLSTAFRKETGMTVTDYINKTRIRQALILLNTTSLPVGEISSRCGFFDSNYFSRVFRKFQGQSPKQYRSMIHQKTRGSESSLS